MPPPAVGCCLYAYSISWILIDSMKFLINYWPEIYQMSNIKEFKGAGFTYILKKNLKKGHIIKESDLTFKRPAHGISPKFIDEIVGKATLQDLNEDDILRWYHIE